MVISIVLLLVFTFFLMGIKRPRVVFFPEGDPNSLHVYITMPEGTHIDVTNEICKQVETKDKGVIFESLGTGLIQQGLEAYMLTATKGAKSGSKGVSHLGDELVFCLQGKFLFEVKKEKYTIEEGDSLLFKGSLPQQWENIGNGDSVLLLVRGMEK